MFGLRFTNYLVQHICPTIWVHPLAVIPGALSYNNQQPAEAEEKLKINLKLRCQFTKIWEGGQM